MIFIFSLNLNISSAEILTDDDKISEGTYVYDPYEGINRAVLSFNMAIDDIAIQPVINVYKVITPDIAERGVSNFFYNLKEPLKTITFLFQGDLKNSMNSMGRFIVNTTTSLGLYDTSKHLGLKKNKSDMGIVLGKAGINSGPYLIIPIIGPTNFRDLTGKVLDFTINPINLIGVDSSMNSTIGSTLSVRAEYDNELNDLKSNSNDLYDSLKLLYHQRRMGDINNEHLKDLPVPEIYID
ncbi:MAG: VacJ family lipoprotein [Proteobacteria bacterium]|nr:VacJ family lipoprotein [Pseudomonadota bacterium]